MHVFKNILAGIGAIALFFATVLFIAIALAGDESDMDLEVSEI